MLGQTVVQTRPRVRSLRVSVNSIETHRYQQARSFRFGLWPFYHDSSHARDIRRRHRMLYYNYVKSLNRNQPGEHHDAPPHEYDIFVPRRMRPRRRLNNDPYGEKKPRCEDHINPIINLGEFHKRFTEKVTKMNHFPWGAHLTEVFNDWMDPTSTTAQKEAQKDQGKPRPSAPTDQTQESSVRFEDKNSARDTADSSNGDRFQNEDYIIDPISNKRIRKPPAHSTNDEVRDAKAQTQSQTENECKSETSATPQPDEPVLTEELSKYGVVQTNPTTLESVHAQYTTGAPGRTAEGQAEEYSLNHLPPEDGAEVLEEKPKRLVSHVDENPDNDTLPETLRQIRQSAPDASPTPNPTERKIESQATRFNTGDVYRLVPPHLQKSMSDHALGSDAIDREMSTSLTHFQRETELTEKEGPSRLTGNFVRDFPEEFTETWPTFTPSPDCEQSPESEPRIEPALDRLESSPDLAKRAELEADPYSKIPQGLETSYEQECQSAPPETTFTKSYGKLEKQPLDDQSAESTSVPQALAEELVAPVERTTSKKVDSLPRTSPQSTRYKILAYDPTTESIHVSETTSTVPDLSSPMTPTDALTRLNDPSKFTQFLGDVGAEGFEIVSGGSNILVFRQVDAKRFNAPAQDGSDSIARTLRVNPIDMMGRSGAPRPSAATFASPTGFVNYNDPPCVVDEPAVQVRTPEADKAASEATETPDRVPSNIEVRREEPVFSGPKIHQIPRQEEKRGTLTKALIGGVWVAGLSYAFGVVGEYFV